MFRTSVITALCAATVFAASAGATAPPVGPLPKGPVTSIVTPKGTLVSVALRSRSGYSWRLARNVNPKVLVQVSEANVGTSVVVVYRAVGIGSASVSWALTRGEGRKAYASARYDVRVS